MKKLKVRFSAQKSTGMNIVKKNSKFFLNLDKRNGSQNTIKLLANNESPEHEQIETNPKDILTTIKKILC